MEFNLAEKNAATLALLQLGPWHMTPATPVAHPSVIRNTGSASASY